MKKLLICLVFGMCSLFCTQFVSAQNDTLKLSAPYDLLQMNEMRFEDWSRIDSTAGRNVRENSKMEIAYDTASKKRSFMEYFNYSIFNAEKGYECDFISVNAKNRSAAVLSCIQFTVKSSVTLNGKIKLMKAKAGEVQAVYGKPVKSEKIKSTDRTALYYNLFVGKKKVEVIFIFAPSGVLLSVLLCGELAEGSPSLHYYQTHQK